MKRVASRTSVAVALLVATALLGAEPLASKRTQFDVAGLARDLAKCGRPDEVAVLREVARELGLPEKDAERLDKVCEQRLAKAPKRAPGVAREAKKLERVVGELAKQLATSEGEPRTKLARVMVRLDSDNAAAHEALNHERLGGSWHTSEGAKAWRRRGQIAAALQAARTLEIEVERVETGHPTLKEIEGKAGVGARARGLTVYSNLLEPAMLDRIVRESLRARAVSRFLRGGKLEDAKAENSISFLVFRDKASYGRWIESAIRSGIAPAAQREHLLNWTYYQSAAQRLVACQGLSESRLMPVIQLCSWLIWSADEYGGEVQPCLTAGHVGWVCRSYLGAELPGYANLSRTENSRESSTTAKPDAGKEREWFLTISEAGMYGSRAWMRYLVQHNEDPPWRNAMVDLLSNIGGTDLTKAIFVAEYLQEQETLDALIRDSMGRDPTAGAVMRDALRKPFGEFELEWRRWILEGGGARGVLQALRGSGASEIEDPGALEAARHLEGIRKAALGEDAKLWLDPDLCAGALAHCRYLNLHPKQASAWPDAHEEYPDKEGFSIAGHWAGQHSVIVSGSSSPADAIDAWMATVYHRFPLIRPGLVGIGWAREGNTALLDSTSLVKPPPIRWVGWPPPDARDVPLRFANGELPHPVPGEDQSRWGYPITLQLFGYFACGDVEMELLDADMSKVDCHLSTPNRPTNPELAPADCYFLIPKSALRPKSLYTVNVRNLPDGTSTRWTFRTR